MKFSDFSFFGILGLCCIILNGCGSNTASFSSTEADAKARRLVKNISVEEYMIKSESIQNFTEQPRRVLTAGMEEVEMTLAFANPESIIGVYGFNDLTDYVKPQYKEELQSLNIMKPGELNMERVVSLQPDLIIAEQGSFTSKSLRTTKFWNDRGVRTYVPQNTNNPGKHVQAESIAGEIQYIRDFGTIFHQEEKAERYVTDIQQARNFFQQHKTGRPKVLILEHFGSSIASYDRTKIAGQIAEAVGGYVPETMPLMGEEDVVFEDPDVLFIVCSDGDHGACMRWFIDNPAFQMLKSRRNRRIYSIELENIYAPGIRLKDGIERMGLCLYPELEKSYLETQKNTINPSYSDWLVYKSMDNFDL